MGDGLIGRQHDVAKVLMVNGVRQRLGLQCQGVVVADRGSLGVGWIGREDHQTVPIGVNGEPAMSGHIPNGGNRRSGTRHHLEGVVVFDLAGFLELLQAIGNLPGLTKVIASSGGGSFFPVGTLVSSSSRR